MTDWTRLKSRPNHTNEELRLPRASGNVSEFESRDGCRYRWVKLRDCLIHTSGVAILLEVRLFNSIHLLPAISALIPFGIRLEFRKGQSKFSKKRSLYGQ